MYIKPYYILGAPVFLILLIVSCGRSRADEFHTHHHPKCTHHILSKLKQNEGWHHCAYDTGRGYRAIGVGYNLDDDPDQSTRDLREIAGADFKQVYEGSKCLDATAISDLAEVSLRRTKSYVQEHVKNLQQLCCSIQAALVDLYFSLRHKEHLHDAVGHGFFDKVQRQDWREAASHLRSSDLCTRGRELHAHQRCKENARHIEAGCRSTTVVPVSRKCMREAAAAVEASEGPGHSCAYDSGHGYQAVGFGYNLEDSPAKRARELRALGLDYTKVQTGEECLDDDAMAQLLLLNVRNVLHFLQELYLPKLHKVCCAIPVAVADLYFGLHKAQEFDRALGDGFVDALVKEDWEGAAKELRRSDWCSSNRIRCDLNLQRLERGCDSPIGYEFGDKYVA